MNNQASLQQELASLRNEIDQVARDIKQAIAGGRHELKEVERLFQSVYSPISMAQQCLTSSASLAQQPKSDFTKSISPSARTPVYPPAHSQPTTRCRFCKRSVYKNQLKEHIANMHPFAVPFDLPPKPKKAAKKAKKAAANGGEALASQTKKRPSVPSAGAAPEPQTPKQLNPCPVCSVPVRSDRLSKHLAKVHPQAQPSAPLNGRSTPPAQTPSAKNSRARKGSSVSATSQAYLPSTRYGEEASLEALDQSYRDRRDGGKELSQSRRDHGQFGSLPVYDDYSEDSYS